MGSLARVRPLMLAVVLVQGGGIAGCMQPPPRPKMAELTVIAEPADTTVYINDKFVGTARVLSRKAKRLKPGVKYITFKAANHFPHDVRLDLPAGETKVRMKLRPIPE